MQKARWHNPVCSCLFFYISGYFLLTLYFPFIFSLDSKPPNLGGKKRLQGLVCVCGGVHQLCAVPHRCTSPQYTAGHAACLSQPAPVCSLCESVSFSMEPLETDIKIYPENLLFLRLQKMCLLVPQPHCQILIYLFIFQSDLISQLQRGTFFSVHVQKMPWPLAIPSASHVWGLPFESKLFAERHYLSGNSSVKTT